MLRRGLRRIGKGKLLMERKPKVSGTTNAQSFKTLFTYFLFMAVIIVGCLAYVAERNNYVDDILRRAYELYAYKAALILSTIAIVIWANKNKGMYKQGGSKRNFVFLLLCFSAIFLTVFTIVSMAVIYFVASI